MYEYDLTTEAGKDYQVARVGSDIEEILPDNASAAVATYDLNGRPATPEGKGIYLEKEDKNGQSTYRKVLKR